MSARWQTKEALATGGAASIGAVIVRRFEWRKRALRHQGVRFVWIGFRPSGLGIQKSL